MSSQPLLFACGLTNPALGLPSPARRQAAAVAPAQPDEHRRHPVRPPCRWCLACQLASWFNAYTLVRTYSNCLEALCIAAGAYHWLCSGARGGGSREGGSGKAKGGSSSSKAGRSEATSAVQRRHQRTWIACAALSVVFRPASALFWLLPAGLALWRQRGRALGRLLLDAASVGGGLLGASLLLDRAFYGR